MSQMPKSSGYLGGHLLVAMPQMPDPRFARSVVYLCAHTSDGAMGLIINKLIDSLSFPDLLRQLSIEPPEVTDAIRVHFGGPVEAARGFVLHSTDYVHDATMVVDDQFALTATVDVLKAIAKGNGPRRSLLALGYAGWAPGQLDQEIQSNGWLTVPAAADLVFGAEVEHIWQQAIERIGVDLTKLSSNAGHA
ncbi:MAG: YqgE/AlgH family protein [Alphaproteobacteria bacterium]|nr:YqgE/AlgH family protein [Alphaproteobacteria bacterium]